MSPKRDSTDEYLFLGKLIAGCVEMTDIPVYGSWTYCNKFGVDVKRLDLLYAGLSKLTFVIFPKQQYFCKHTKYITYIQVQL